MKSKIKHEQLILLFDFDLTICMSSYPELGEPYKYAKEVLTKFYNQGCYIIINTCRTGLAQLEAEAWLLKHRIPFHKINDHHPNGLLHYGTDRQIEHNLTSRKIWGHLNYDDTNIHWAVYGHPGFEKIDELTQIYIKRLGPENKYGIKPDTNYDYIL